MKRKYLIIVFSILFIFNVFATENEENSIISDLVSEETYITALLLNDKENHDLYYRRGNIRGKLNLLDEAINDFDTAINIKPDEAAYYFVRAYTKSLQGKYQEAIADYTEAISLNDAIDGYFFYRGIAKINLRLLDAAIDDFTAAININSNESAYYFYRAYIKREQQKYQEAVEDYTKSISLNETNDIFYFERGYTKRLQNNYRAAIIDYNKAISFNKTNDAYYFHRGFSQNQLNNFNEAFEDYSKAIELNTQISLAYYNRGVIYKQRKEYQLAIDDYNQAISLTKDPSDLSKYYNSRGNAYSSWGNKEQAIKDYLHAAELNPNNSDPHHNLGLLYKNDLELYDEAIKHFSYAIDSGSRNEFTFLNRGLSYEILGEDEKAVEDFDKTLEINKNHYGVLKYRARVKAKLGDFYGAGIDFWQDEQNTDRLVANSHSRNSQENAPSHKIDTNQALKGLTNAIKLTESHPHPYYSLALICKNDLELYQLAIFYFTKAVDLSFKDDGLVNRGLTYEIIGEYEKAVEDFDKTLEINKNHYTALGYRARVKAKSGDFYGAGIDYWQIELGLEKRFPNNRINSKEEVDYWQERLSNNQ
ncbi:MAG: tetratricopeptide repeat protein [Treponema sp.]|jgi:tetratricopeptide (TPR) repeat protein|nr:tetratricopeptide repeat protein [Treponema sp.]